MRERGKEKERVRPNECKQDKKNKTNTKLVMSLAGTGTKRKPCLYQQEVEINPLYFLLETRWCGLSLIAPTNYIFIQCQKYFDPLIESERERERQRETERQTDRESVSRTGGGGR